MEGFGATSFTDTYRFKIFTIHLLTFFLTLYYVELEIGSLNLQGTGDKSKRSEIFCSLRKKISAYTYYKRNIVLRGKLQLILVL